MQRSVQLDDQDYAGAIDREIDHIRDSNVLGRSSKLRDLFEYLVVRSRSGPAPREVEIAQDVFGRTGQQGDDGAARVYIHRLRRRLEDIYKERHDAELRIACPLGEYRLVAELGPVDSGQPDDMSPPPRSEQRGRWRSMVLGVAIGLILATFVVWAFVPWPAPGWREAAQARRSEIWAPLFANGRSVIIAEGDHYLFTEKSVGGESRLVRDYRIHSREDLDAYLLGHGADAARYSDAGLAYVPATAPRAQLYLSRILLAVGNVRVLPASQVPAAAMLSQNIVFLGLTSGLGPLHAPVAAGSRFEPGQDADEIRDTRTGSLYRSDPPHDRTSPRRQYGLVSLFAGKEGNRYMVLAGTSEMGLVGLVETLADPARLTELARAAGGKDTVEALYQVDSQGGGVLAVRLIATNARDQRRVWQP